jgi:hypothetical protein
MVIECSSLSLSKVLIKNTAALIPATLIPIFYLSGPSHAIDINNAPQLFQSSCGMCHTGGGNSLPFSQGKTLSAIDLKTNGYDNVDNIVGIINKVIIFLVLLC